ncbi:MAG: hypothetical protein PVI30_22965 [Myxococcales bacterium]
MKNATWTCLAVAAALAGCQEPNTENALPVAQIEIRVGTDVYESDEGIETDGSDVTVTLDGSMSSDEDGNITGYQWLKTDVAAADRMGGAEEYDENGATLQVTLGLGTHRFSLWVSDDEGAVSSPASVNVVVTSAAACLTIYSSDVPGCAECMCQASAEMGGGCRDEINLCLANPDEKFQGLCQMIVDCAATTGCSAEACYLPDTCMMEIDTATADYGGVASCSGSPAPESPCAASSAIAACMADACAAECGIMTM